MPCETRINAGRGPVSWDEKPVAVIDVAEVELPDWSDYSVKELKEECAGYELKGYSRLKRAELEAALAAAGATPCGECK